MPATYMAVASREGLIVALLLHIIAGTLHLYAAIHAALLCLQHCTSELSSSRRLPLRAGRQACFDALPFDHASWLWFLSPRCILVCHLFLFAVLPRKSVVKTQHL
jgi:hypothetical protein